MRLVTAAEMAELDRRAVEEYGIPRLLLMEHAGTKVALVARTLLAVSYTHLTLPTNREV